MNKEELKLRTKNFALRVINLVNAMPNTINGRTIAGQLSRCGTSVAANYRATLRARSDAEFLAKLGIVIEETDEVMFWLEIISESQIFSEQKVADLHKEAKELISVFYTPKQTKQQNMKNKS